jgi:hypothetical protein
MFGDFRRRGFDSIHNPETENNIELGDINSIDNW